MMSSRTEAAAVGTDFARPWLTIVGIGEDGIQGLGEAAIAAIAAAEIVFGGTRHLELARTLIAGEKCPWPSPFAQAVEGIAALKGRQVCVLASGDPFHFGVGATLAKVIDSAEMRVLPAPSAFSLAAAKLGWPLQTTETISLHGRPTALMSRLLHPGCRIIALTSDGEAPCEIAALLTRAGFAASSFHVLEALGGPRERVVQYTAETIGARAFDDLNVIAIEVIASPTARILPLGTGLDEKLFEHDGQITKPEVRAITLAALQPKRGQLLWDIGAGSGSVSIEWMRQHCSMHAIAVEADAVRAERIARNAENFGVPGLQVVTGTVPEALLNLPKPAAIFIGGGGSTPGVMETAMEALGRNGRLVANAVTLETQAALLDLHDRLEGELIEIAIARAAPVGGMTTMRPALPVTQWRWTKP